MPQPKAGSGRTILAGANSRVGDFILAIEGATIREPQDLFDALEKQKIGDTITVTVLRDKVRKNIKVTLKEL